MNESDLVEKFNLLDRAAKKDMHWWFFMLLMIGMAYVGYERWESAKERSAMREEINRVREAQLDYMQSRVETLQVTIANNTRAMDDFGRILSRMEAR